MDDEDQYSQAGFESQLQLDLPLAHPHYNWPSGHWLVSSPVLCEAETNNVNEAARLSLEERNSLPLPAAWGLCTHHQTKLSKVGSAPLPPAEAEDEESNQLQPRTQHSQLINHSLLFFLLQTALLRTNLRKTQRPQQLFSALTPEGLLRSRLASSLPLPATTTCRPILASLAPVPASHKHRQISSPWNNDAAASTSLTQQPYLHDQAIAFAASSSRATYCSD